MRNSRLSAIFIAVSAASLLMASTVSIAAHKTHKVAKAEEQNFKGEANFKAEVPAPCPPPQILRDGFYVGAGVGYDIDRIHSNSNITLTSNDTDEIVDTLSASAHHGAAGWMGGIFVGYGHYFDMFYLGLEVNGNDSAAKASSSFYHEDTDDFDFANVTVKARGSYGVALLPGLKLNDSTLLYVRLGYLRANFKSSGDAGIAGLGYNFSSSKWRNGFQYGVGLETYVAESVSLRGEFDHTNYDSRSFNRSFVVEGATKQVETFTLSTSGSVKPSANEFMLSLLYHFA